MLPDSKALVDGLTLTRLHRQRYPKLPLPCISRYHRPQNLVPSSFYLPVPYWRCFALAVTHGKHREFFIFQETLAYKLAFQQDVGPGTIQKILLPTSGFVWF